MFERFDTWLIIGFVVVTLFCGIDAWITNLYRRIKEQAGDNRRLRHALNEARQENAWLLARCESMTDHRTFIRDTEIDRLTAELKTKDEKIDELQTLLEQKWAGASQKEKGAKKK